MHDCRDLVTTLTGWNPTGGCAQPMMDIHSFQLSWDAATAAQTFGDSDLLAGAVAGLVYKLAELMQLAGSADNIQSGELFEQLSALTLSHAAN